jgi:hypothetical protein
MKRLFPVLSLVCVLAGCKTDGSAQDPASPSTPAAATSNSAPLISGAPPRVADVGRGYAFKPQAQDPNGDPLTFSISNKPMWAHFDAATGELSGQPAPTQVGHYQGIVIAVSDGKMRSAMPGFSIEVVDKDLTPSIQGTPAMSVTAGSAYTFTPMASDPGGAALTFSIANKPQWAAFNESTGQLSGTPDAGDVGTFANIVIGVSNGVQSDALPAFSITVNQPGSSQGSAMLSWTPPTQNTDGSALTDLAGYRIYYGTDPTALTKTISLKNAGISSYVISNLAAATWYFSIKSFNATNVESTFSATVSKTIK